MDEISQVSIGPLAANSRYICPLTMKYKQNGVDRSWDLMRVHDAVALLVFNTTRRVLVFVRQFRPAVYFSQLPTSACTDMSQLSKSVGSNIHTSSTTPSTATSPDTPAVPGSRGVTLELCAGCVDKKLPLVDIAREELLEECGYRVEGSRLQLLKTFVGAVGVSGSAMHLFYVEVTDDDRATAGGGNSEEGERLEVVEMSVDEVRQYMSQMSINSPPGFLFAIYWFFMHVLKEPL